MKRFIITTIAFIMLMITDGYSQTEKSSGNLTFKISGFSENSGQVIVELFRREDKVPTKPFKLIKTGISEKSATAVAENLPFGEYAAIIVHDKNSNGIIDHQFGMPAEPLRYTNDWKLSLFSGMPTFEKLKFAFSASDCQITIRMKE